MPLPRLARCFGGFASAADGRVCVPGVFQDSPLDATPQVFPDGLRAMIEIAVYQDLGRCSSPVPLSPARCATAVPLVISQSLEQPGLHVFPPSNTLHLLRAEMAHSVYFAMNAGGYGAPNATRCSPCSP